MKEIELPPESQLVSLFHKPGFTPPNEVKYLVWLARQTVGNILELGCHDGQTTIELAKGCLDKKVVGVDYTGSDVTLCPEQRWEKPDGEKIGRLVRGMSNVAIFDQKSADIDYASFACAIGFIFIDADHSY